MAQSLGIFVTSDRYMNHILGITKAAKAKGSDVTIFLTWKGTRLAKDPRFSELCKLAHVDICADSYKKMGWDPLTDIPEGLTDKNMSTQAKHGAIIDNCDKYISF
ncbi:MAG: DsrE family protein [Desulfobacterales bacterium]|nr:DsrE family protein [Desulfobacterales bacterium]